MKILHSHWHSHNGLPHDHPHAHDAVEVLIDERAHWRLAALSGKDDHARHRHAGPQPADAYDPAPELLNTVRPPVA